MSELMSFTRWRQLDEMVTHDQLSQILRWLTAKFKLMNIAFQFSDHFLERVNDIRNKPAISAQELVNIFNKELSAHSGQMKMARPNDELLFKDMATDINVPIGVHWDYTRRMLLFRAITVMRKKSFGSDNFKNKILTV